MSKAKIRAQGGLSPEKYLTKEQQQKLLSYIKAQADLSRARGSKQGVIDELICLLLVQAGLRAGELCNLRLRNLPPYHSKDCIRVEVGKGGVARTIDIPKKLSQAIKLFCSLHHKKAKPEDYLFVSCKGKQLCYMTVYQKIRRIGQQSGVGKLHPHMLRHTYATKLYGVERDLLFVSDQLGHSNVSTTQIYAKTDSEARRQQIEKMVKD